MDVIDIERALTSYLSNRLGLELDAGIYRGAIPAGVGDGVAVLLNNEIKMYGIRPRTYNAQVLGKYSDRDESYRLLSKLNEFFPVWDAEIDGLRFRSILPRGSGVPYQDADDGGRKYFVSYNMLVSVLTSGSQA